MDTLEQLMASAHVALAVTYGERCHLPMSPWFAYLGQYDGVIVARTDNPEEPVPSEWREICRVNNAATDPTNMATIRAALSTMPIYCAHCGSTGARRGDPFATPYEPDVGEPLCDRCRNSMELDPEEGEQ